MGRAQGGTQRAKAQNNMMGCLLSLGFAIFHFGVFVASSVVCFGRVPIYI